MFPVDASAVAALNAHASHAAQMLQALKESGREVRRVRPRRLWSVQSFNMHNLRNSGIGADELLDALRETTTKSRGSGAASAPSVMHPAALGEIASGASTWLVERLFDGQQLVPVRRPHPADEVVANLADHNSSVLSMDYLKDLERLRDATIHGLRPNHYCKIGSRSEAEDCAAEPWEGSKFVEVLQVIM